MLSAMADLYFEEWRCMIYYQINCYAAAVWEGPGELADELS